MDILPFSNLPVLYWICIRNHWKYTQIKAVEATIVASHILVLYVLYFCCLTWNVGHTMNGMVFLVVYNFCIFDCPSLSRPAWWSQVVILPMAETVCKTFPDQCLSNVDVSALLFPFCICSYTFSSPRQHLTHATKNSNVYSLWWNVAVLLVCVGFPKLKNCTCVAKACR